MDGQRGTEAGQRRWNDLSARDQAEVDRSLYKGAGVRFECADLAADRAAALGAMTSLLAWLISALAALAVIDAVFYSESGPSAWVYPAVVLVFTGVAHALRLRLRKARRINTRPERESGPDPELDHVVELIRGSTRVQVALGCGGARLARRVVARITVMQGEDHGHVPPTQTGQYAATPELSPGRGRAYICRASEAGTSLG